MRTVGENSRVTLFPTAAGTIINGAAGGTVNGAPLGEFEYHTVQFIGTFANDGSINAYACTNAGGSNPVIVRSISVGSSNNPWAAIDIKSSAMGSLSMALGTQYTHLGAYATVASGGTWRGALSILSTWPRVAPPGTTGLAAYGTYLT